MKKNSKKENKKNIKLKSRLKDKKENKMEPKININDEMDSVIKLLNETLNNKKMYEEERRRIDAMKKMKYLNQN